MGRQQSQAGTGSPLDTVCGWLLSLSTLAFIIAAGYLAYGALALPREFYGYDIQAQKPLPMAQYGNTLGNIQLMLRIMTLSGVGIVLGALGRYWVFHETGIALAILGAGLFFGAPNLFQSSSAAIPEQVRNRALALILYHTHILSVAILAAAGLHLLVHAVLVFRDARQRRPLRRTDIAPGAFAGRPALEKRDRFFGPCWNLPFCRDTVKRRCPILHSRQPCWRKGRGCYCDNEIVITLSGERLAGSRPTAAGFIKPQEIQPRKVLDARTKRQQCLGCPIYLYHQDHKYRVLAPLVVLGVIAFVAYNKARLDALYPEVVRGLGRALSGLSYSPANRTGVPAWAEDLAQTTGVEWLLLVVGTVLLIAYLVHAVEWILYKWGI